MLAYSESFYAVRFLMQESGSATPAQLLHTVAALGGFEEGIEALSGRTLEEFERDVVASFERRFGWGVLLSRWNVLFAAVTLLLLVGGAARLARSRRLMREWEAEESARARGTGDSSGGSGSRWS